MKRLFALLFATVATITLTPSEAAAAPSGCHQRQAYSCNRCGAPVYQVPVVVGYDCHGHPIVRMTTASHQCMPRCASPVHSHRHGHSKHGHSKHGRKSHRH